MKLTSEERLLIAYELNPTLCDEIDREIAIRYVEQNSEYFKYYVKESK